MECFATLFLFISTNTAVKLPKNVYQLNELSGSISGLDSEHSTQTPMSEVFGLIPKYLNHNPPFSINFALNFPYFFISLIFKHCHTQNEVWCQGFENKIFLFWSSRYYIKLPMYIILMRFFKNCP